MKLNGSHTLGHDIAGIYGAMVLVGQTVCHLIGIDGTGGFELSADVAMEGLGYAIPPVMALLFILDVSLCFLVYYFHNDVAQILVLICLLGL